MKKRLLIVTFNTVSNSKIPTWLQAQQNSRKILDTTWFVVTTDAPTQFFAKIEPFIEKDNERVFIGELNGERQGWLSTTIWDWIKEQFN